jgi:hexosaminidase
MSVDTFSTHKKKFLDHMALHKLNTFHWHLCDDQGWRIEIQKYPLLTANYPEGAIREPKSATVKNYYTQDEVRQIVDYAITRGIVIIPEIEMPGTLNSYLYLEKNP